MNKANPISYHTCYYRRIQMPGDNFIMLIFNGFHGVHTRKTYQGNQQNNNGISSDDFCSNVKGQFTPPQIPQATLPLFLPRAGTG
jgi:hypothetical protein|nr:hypothetical protein [Desulfotignum phosphitoxidans]